MKKIVLIAAAILAELYLASYIFNFGNELPKRHGAVDYEFYQGEKETKALVVGFGGAEGGNTWTRSRWKTVRDQLLDSGYAFLAVEYFGGPKTPSELDRISLDAINDTIIAVAKRAQIDTSNIALIGGSKGGELILNLASRYNNYTAAIAIVPGKASFPGHTFTFNNSSWMFDGREVAFAPAPWKSIIPIIKRESRKAMEMILEDKEAVAKAAIEIEKINGPILFLSGTKDEMWPSTEMSNDMTDRLGANGFAHYYEHVAIPGGHRAPLDHFDLVHEFLSKNFKPTLYQVQGRNERRLF